MGGPASSLNMMVRASEGGPGSGGIKLDGAAAFFIGPLNEATGGPVQGAIFEVADAADVVAMSPAMTLTRLGETNWVALTNQAYTLPATGSTLGTDMLDSTVSINLDQAGAVAAYRPQIEGLLAMMQMPPPAGVMTDSQAAALQRSQAANAAKIKMFLDMIASWNIGIDLDGAELDTLLRTVPTNEAYLTKPSGDLEKLARLIPADMPVTAVMDQSALRLMMEMSKADLDALPPEAGSKMEALWPEWMKSMDTMKSGVAFGFSFGDKGISMVSVMDTEAPQAALASIKDGWKALGSADIGISLEPLAILRGDGVGYTVKMDLKKMMDEFGVAGMIPQPQSGQPDPMAMAQMMMDNMIGPDGLPVRYLIEGNHIVGVVGNRHLVEARSLVSSGGGDNRLSGLIAASLAPSTFAVDMDIRAVADEGLVLARQMLGPMGAMLPPEVPAGPPVPLSFVGSSNGSNWDQCRIRTNLKSWYTLMQQFQPKPPPATAAGSPAGVN
jgi:hypothetical protein